MKTIYNKDGDAVTCEAVDAREMIETGEWFAENPVANKSRDDKTKSHDKPVSRGPDR